jgi:hypothetical protein
MLTVSLLLAITAMTVLPGQAVYDHIILLPGILTIAGTWRRVAASSRPFAIIFVVGTLTLFWQWIVAMPLLAARLFISPADFNKYGLLVLPFHAAASVPASVAGGLGFLIWTQMRDDKAFQGNSSATEGAVTKPNPAEGS